MHRHIHKTKLCIVLHLFLSVKCHCVVGVHTCGIDKIAALDKHTARTAGRVKQNARFGFKYVYYHLDKRFWGKENAVVLCDVFRKLVEEIFVYPTDNITADIIKSGIVEYAKKFKQKLVRKNGVFLRQHADKLLTLLLNKLHCIVYDLAQTVHWMSRTVGKPCSRNVFGQLNKIFVLCFIR